MASASAPTPTLGLCRAASTASTESTKLAWLESTNSVAHSSRYSAGARISTVVQTTPTSRRRDHARRLVENHAAIGLYET